MLCLEWPSNPRRSITRSTLRDEPLASADTSGNRGDDGGGEEPAGEDGYPHDDATETNGYV